MDLLSACFLQGECVENTQMNENQSCPQDAQRQRATPEGETEPGIYRHQRATVKYSRRVGGGS